MSTSPVTVLLVDDQDLIREALRALLIQEPSIQVVGQARNGMEAVERAKTLGPDVVLMDVRMPGLSGPEATAQIKSLRTLSNTRVLMLTTFEEGDVVRACIDAGADGVIGKGASTAALIEAIHAVRRGESPLSPRAARALLADIHGTAKNGAQTSHELKALTSREVDIVKLVALGLSNDELGRRLRISPATAKTHVRNAMRKLNIHDRSHLVAFVHRVGLIP